MKLSCLFFVMVAGRTIILSIPNSLFLLPLGKTISLRIFKHSVFLRPHTIINIKHSAWKGCLRDNFCKLNHIFCSSVGVNFLRLYLEFFPLETSKVLTSRASRVVGFGGLSGPIYFFELAHRTWRASIIFFLVAHPLGISSRKVLIVPGVNSSIKYLPKEVHAR